MLNKALLLCAGGGGKNEPLGLTIEGNTAFYYRNSDFTFDTFISYETMIQKGWSGKSSDYCGMINPYYGFATTNCRIQQATTASAYLYISDPTKPAKINK